MYVGLKQPRGDGERCVTPARAAAKETLTLLGFGRDQVKIQQPFRSNQVSSVEQLIDKQILAVSMLALLKEVSCISIMVNFSRKLEDNNRIDRNGVHVVCKTLNLGSSCCCLQWTGKNVEKHITHMQSDCVC